MRADHLPAYGYRNAETVKDLKLRTSRFEILRSAQDDEGRRPQNFITIAAMRLTSFFLIPGAGGRVL